MPPHPSNGQQAPQVVTYRHVHSSTIGPQHPFRVIAHCDIDAAYAQFEQVRLGIDPSKPLAVQQWAGLIAINYPARSKGITRFHDLQEAYKKCPELICVHVATYAQGEGENEAKYHEDPRPETHKVSLDTYRRESLKILKIFSAVPGAVVEKASIDESFFDLSLPVRDIMRERYGSYLHAPPVGSKLGMDTPLPDPPPIDWTGLGELVPAVAAEDGRQAAGDVVGVKEAGSERVTWSDVSLAIGAELMARCRQQVFDDLKYTCSAGIARNKMLAKLCSAYKKPANQTVLRDVAALSFLRPLKFQKIRWLGGKLGVQLAEATSATTVGDLWTVPLEELQTIAGEGQGMWVWEIVRGVDSSEVEMKRETKSMLSSKNFRPSISTWGEGIHWLRVLSTELVARLQEAREVTPGVWPKTITLHRRNDAYVSTAKQTAFPFTSRLTIDYILKHAQRLLIEFVPGNLRLADMADSTSVGRVTSLALALHNLERVESGQKGIEGFLGVSTTTLARGINPAGDEEDDLDLKGKRKASETFVPLSTRPKHSKIDVGSFVVNGDGEESSTLLDSAPSSKPSRRRSASPTANRAPAEQRFNCPRCKRVLRVPLLPSSPTSGSSADFAAAALERLKSEHADEHFARDLHDEERKANRPPEMTASGGKSGGGKKSKGGGGAKPKIKPKADIGSFFRSNGQSSK